MQTLLIRPQKIHVETAAILQPKGSLSDNSVVGFLHQANTAMMSEKHSSVIIDMNQVDSIDSVGLMAIIDTVKLARRANKRFCLCSVPRSVCIVFELTQLDRVVEIFESLSAFNLTPKVAA
ncbi:anti-sigma factor antagonist [Phormidium sp. CLA17]|uniref:STAS domain-containing protein n=1 Tax=Leptolyngbya sp. Cla-17 TaxID=2803751 RepID=UPI0014909E43|nr:STAS domain-containing protein [Leptolyngbya sp. Cla-17]MBM0741057.1 anti-sigma factor antagonist [Leptolyngbya sp. Cla-17]